MSQWLERSHGLDQQQLDQIRQLEQACTQLEPLTMKLNWDTLQSRPVHEINDFLYYEQNRLIGYLALYTFNRREAEVSAMTHPAYRGTGIFRQLLEAARQELQKRSIPDFLFICEQGSVSGAGCMRAIGARYEFSEYRMALGQLEPGIGHGNGLELRPATAQDIQDLARMDAICFGTTVEDSARYLERDLAQQHRRILVVTLEKQKIGKIGILLDDVETYIFAFCVLPEHRGKGYGTAVLSRTVTELVAEKQPNIVLEVACKNESALRLYERVGFRTTTAYDYYRLPV